MNISNYIELIYFVYTWDNLKTSVTAYLFFSNIMTLLLQRVMFGGIPLWLPL